MCIAQARQSPGLLGFPQKWTVFSHEHVVCNSLLGTETVCLVKVGFRTRCREEKSTSCPRDSEIQEAQAVSSTAGENRTLLPLGPGHTRAASACPIELLGSGEMLKTPVQHSQDEKARLLMDTVHC